MNDQTQTSQMVCGFETDEGIVYFGVDDETPAEQDEQQDEPTLCGFEMDDGTIVYYEV